MPTSTRLRVVVIGSGIAGLSAAEAARAASEDAEIVIVSQEAELPYYRLNLTRYVAGEIGKDKLPIHLENWYANNRMQFRLNSEVVEIDPQDLSVVLHNGERIKYDKLIIANGAHPFVPPIQGSSLKNVFCLRTIGDAERILELALPGAHCVCIGGGTLGLETAGALCQRGCSVTLLEHLDWLLPRQLNQEAARRLQQHAEALNIRFILGSRNIEIIGDRSVQAVQTEGQKVFPADVVVIAAGVRSNNDLARKAGLKVNRGIVVDDRMNCSRPDIFAAGDVCEHRGVCYGLWLPAVLQGKVAGTNAVLGTSEFNGIPPSNTIRVLGFNLFSIGQFEPKDDNDKVFDLPTDKSYFRFLFKGNQLCGAVLAGDIRLMAKVKNMVEKKADFSALLANHPSPQMVAEYLANTERDSGSRMPL
jgi:nitrite reductase (NADH) large subunit